jgi:Replication initiator protein A
LLPLFRLSDSAEEGAVSYTPGPPAVPGSRWRVLPAPNDRLPGTFDQDVYVELVHRYHEAGRPADGTITFTLHAFLRTMGRRVDGRTYEQLRGALSRLERTVLESSGAYFQARAPSTAFHNSPPDSEGEARLAPTGGPGPTAGAPAAESRTGDAPGADALGRYIHERFTVLSAVSIERRRSVDRDQLGLFPALTSHEPGEARVVLAPIIRANITAGWTVSISTAHYFELPSPMARRLYRLLSAVGAGTDGRSGVRALPVTWDVALEALAEQLPLSQRYPSHLQRVLEPAHSMLKAAGLVREAAIRQHRRTWVVHYELL